MIQIHQNFGMCVSQKLGQAFEQMEKYPRKSHKHSHISKVLFIMGYVKTVSDGHICSCKPDW